MDSFRRETPEFTAYWEETQGVFYVVYRGVLTSSVTHAVYEWTTEFAQVVNVEEVRGAVYDFRQVTDAETGNLAAVHRESRNLNVRVDTSHTAVALIVETVHQEQIVRISMQVTPGHERKRIVKSMDEALKFIDEYHMKHSATD
ncbi:MAG: hypothetical protein U0694_02785 [Anaerolineae bacterium]